jgi:hypothetical protein
MPTEREAMRCAAVRTDSKGSAVSTSRWQMRAMLMADSSRPRTDVGHHNQGGAFDHFKAMARNGSSTTL